MIEVVGEFQILYRVQFNILTSMTHYYLSFLVHIHDIKGLC